MLDKNNGLKHNDKSYYYRKCFWLFARFKHGEAICCFAYIRFSAIMVQMPIIVDKRNFDDLYNKFNKREFVSPDPLEFLFQYDDIRDREIAGLIAAGLAYGTVRQILRSVGKILDPMPSPREFIETSSDLTIKQKFTRFKHRFTTGDDLANLLIGVKRAIREHGSVENFFLEGWNESDATILPALTKFVRGMNSYSGCGKSYLLPCPSDGSACKRLNLYLRWMVRQDDVDPGGWYNIPASKLIIPLDVHMHRICSAIGLTRRKQPDLRTAVEITDAFREIAPEDPVRYDFCLTRLGIRKDERPDEFIEQCTGTGGECRA